jgi:hypothetical protein
MEPTFLGIGKAEWELYNSFSNWLSAVGTIAAVAISLHLARRAGKAKGAASVGHRLVITPGVPGEPQEVVAFRIVNTGDRAFRVTNIGWVVGLRTKRHAIQLFDPLQSSPMPVELAHGQEGHWIVPLRWGDDPWIQSFPKKMLLPWPWLACRTLRAQFYTSVGDVFTAKPDSDLLDRLESAANAAANAG